MSTEWKIELSSIFITARWAGIRYWVLVVLITMRTSLEVWRSVKLWNVIIVMMHYPIKQFKNILRLLERLTNKSWHQFAIKQSTNLRRFQDLDPCNYFRSHQIFNVHSGQHKNKRHRAHSVPTNYSLPFQTYSRANSESFGTCSNASACDQVRSSLILSRSPANFEQSVWNIIPLAPVIIF
jgi:hypothetical protein